jgi:hypothetical protein
VTVSDDDVKHVHISRGECYHILCTVVANLLRKTTGCTSILGWQAIVPTAGDVVCNDLA